MSILLAATAAALFGIGTYLVLQRKLSRIIVGIGLISHGANLLLVTSGRRGRAPFIGSSDADGFADPLPHALTLTAIVIAFGITAFLLALAYRSWLLTDDDEVADDVDDLAVAHQRHDHDPEIADTRDRAFPDPDDDAAVDPDHEPSDETETHRRDPGTMSGGS